MRRDSNQISSADLNFTRAFMARAIATHGETYLTGFKTTDKALAAASAKSDAMEKALALAAAA